jgi:putative heme-binding domain-containing protein
MYYPMPELIRGWQNGRRDSIWEGKGRKTSGPEIIESSHFPAEWQGAMIAGGYLNNAVWTLKIEDDGAGFRIVDHPALPPLVTSTSGAFRPVDVKLGPDGALYICDWYNPIIGHYQASFRHPDRDKLHGRIWRVTRKGVKAQRPPGREGVRTEEGITELLAQLTSSERFVREQAKRQLFGGDTGAVVKAVRSWTERLDPAGPETEFALVQALGILEAHETVDAALLSRVLKLKSPEARACAAAAIGRWADRLPLDFPAVESLADLAHDENPRVRLAAIVAAGNIPRRESVIVVLSAAEQSRDRFIDTALHAAVAVLQPHWQPFAETGGPGWKPQWRDLLAQLSGVPGKKAAVVQKSETAAIPAVVKTGEIKATPAFVAALVAEVRAKGDVKRGAEVYRRAELICTTCHKIGDQGGSIGPALDSIGSAQPLDFIVGAVLEPQREIKESFETYLFTLKDGRVFGGNIVAGNAEKFTVRDPAGKEQVVQGSEVAGKQMIGSLMPAGLVDRLSREDLRDLFAYLGTLGKPK